MNRIDFKALREDYGYTQVQVSEITGLTVAAISRIDNKKTVPSLETAFKYLNALNLTLEIKTL